MQSIKIGLLISILFFLSCSNRDKLFLRVEGLVIYEFVKEADIDIYRLNNVNFIDTNGECYNFFDDKKSIKFFDKEFNHPYIKKSEFDYELIDSVYNLKLTDAINFRKESTYIYKYGNNNIYNKKNTDTLFLCISIKINGRFYNCDNKSSLCNNNEAIVLDSLISINKLKEIDLIDLEFEKNSVNSINVHFLDKERDSLIP